MKRKISKRTFRLIVLIIFITLVLFNFAEDSIAIDDDTENPPVLKLLKENSTQFFKSMVVTAYINLKKKAKHNHEDYQIWIQTITQIESPMVIYTDSINEIEPLRLNKPTLFVQTSLTRLKKQGGWNSQSINVQSLLDPEGRWHDPNLYVIWDSKTRLVYEASEIYNYWNCEYFFWVDIGSFRTNSSLKYWPDADRVDKAFQGEDRALYAAVYWPLNNLRVYRAEFGPFLPRFIEGTFFAGNKKAIDRLYSKYYELRKEFQNMGTFVGKDQSIMSAVLLANKQDFLILNSTSIPCTDSWFFFQQYFASDAEANADCLASRLQPTIYLDRLQL